MYMYIYASEYCFNVLRFLADVSSKLQFFQQFKDHNSGRERENYTNDLIFFIYFFCTTCL